MLSFTGNSIQCDMTYSELPSWRLLARREGDTVIIKVCGGSQKYDKNNSDLLARAIHLKPQNIKYLNSWLVVFFYFFYFFLLLCLCLCVGSFVCLFDCVFGFFVGLYASKNMRKTTHPFLPAPSTWSLKTTVGCL